MIEIMQIDLNAIPEDFLVKEQDGLFLINPKIQTKWTKDNLIFRSSIWNAGGELVSGGFRKFFNFFEQPELDYTPFSTKANGGVDVLEKRDGSLMIVSNYQGNIIHRTRGTFNAENLDNGFEIAELKQRFPLAFSPPEHLSYLFEWESTRNRIVVKHSELNLVLIGAVDHEDYSLLTQGELDGLSIELGVPRPERFFYDSIKEMLNDVAAWQDREGIVVYSQNGQSMRKVKADEYLRLHRLKSELGNINRVAEFFAEAGCPSYEDTYKLIETSLDFEVAERCKGDIKTVCGIWEEELINLVYLEGCVSPEFGTEKFESRKDAALFIKDRFKDYMTEAFLILDGKPITNKEKLKLIKRRL